MKLFDLLIGNRQLRNGLAAKRRGHALDRGSLPARDHGGMNVLLLGQLSRRQFLADGLQRHLRFELGRVALPFRHADQSFINRQSLATGPNSCDHLSHAVRATIQRSQASLAALSRELGITLKTVAKWRKRPRWNILNEDLSGKTTKNSRLSVSCVRTKNQPTCKC